jgi:Putative peptidoglycan binding domain
LADQPSQTAVRLPLILEVSADLNRLGELGLSQITPAGHELSTLSAPGPRAGKLWLFSYRLEQIESAQPAPTMTSHDFRTMAIETIITSQVMYRLALLLNEVIDIELGSQQANPARYYFDSTKSVFLATESYLTETFAELVSPSTASALHEHVAFEVIHVEPGSLKTTLAVLIGSASLSGCVTTVENIDRVADSVSKHFHDGLRMWVQADEKDEKRKVFRESYRDQIVKELLKGNAKPLQQALKSLGHDPGKIDGIVGPNTINALRGFEHENNLPELDPKSPALAESISDAIATRIVVKTNPLF